MWTNGEGAGCVPVRVRGSVYIWSVVHESGWKGGCLLGVVRQSSRERGYVGRSDNPRRREEVGDTAKGSTRVNYERYRNISIGILFQ